MLFLLLADEGIWAISCFFVDLAQEDTIRRCRSHFYLPFFRRDQALDGAGIVPLPCEEVSIQAIYESIGLLQIGPLPIDRRRHGHG